MTNLKFPIDMAQIVALFMTSMFYGCVILYYISIESEPFRRIFVVTFFNCLHVLLWSGEHFKSRDKINFTMLISALLMFFFATMDVSLAVRQNIEAFILLGGDVVAELENTSRWVIYMRVVDFVAQTLIGDAILIYRCWVIYSRNWPVVAVPTLLWVASTACGVIGCYMEASRAKLLNSKEIVPFGISGLALTVSTNVISTSLIVYRIWFVLRVAPYGPNEKTRLSRIIRVLVESGLMYTTSIVILFVMYVLPNNSQYAVSDAIVQIVGITFNLIIIRVHDGQEAEPIIINLTSDFHSQSNRPISVPLVLARPLDSKPGIDWIAEKGRV